MRLSAVLLTQMLMKCRCNNIVNDVWAATASQSVGVFGTGWESLNRRPGQFAVRGETGRFAAAKSRINHEAVVLCRPSLSPLLSSLSPSLAHSLQQLATELIV